MLRSWSRMAPELYAHSNKKHMINHFAPHLVETHKCKRTKTATGFPSTSREPESIWEEDETFEYCDNDGAMDEYDALENDTLFDGLF